MKLRNLVSVALLVTVCIISSACSTVRNGFSAVGLYDEPAAYDRNDPTYIGEDCLAGYEVKPDAKEWVGKTHDLIKVWRGTSETAPLKLKEQMAILAKIDTSPSDSFITEDEAEDFFKKYRDSLGKGLPIDVSEIGVAQNPVASTKK